MSFKQVAIIIDDFSSRSVEKYDNVWFYDYGVIESGLAWDYYLNNDFSVDGYGDIDYVEVFNRTPAGYQLTDYQNSLAWQTGQSTTFSSTYSRGVGFGGFESRGYEFDNFTAIGHDADLGEKFTLGPRHGDWVLSAFQDQLLDPNAVEIILIDIDNLSSSSGRTQYNNLFSLVPSVHSSTGFVSQVEQIVHNWISRANTDPSLNQYEYLPSTLSISISGASSPPNFGQSVFLESLAQNYITVVQSAPNVGNGVYDWSAFYPEVVSVGAWNIDQNQRVLAASETAIGTVDLFANGLVDYSKFGWGQNFGTSFATPRVAADVVNTWSPVLANVSNAIESGELTREDLANSPAASYNSIVNWLVDSISTDVYVNINNDWLGESVSVLSDDLTKAVNPVTVGLSARGITGLNFNGASLTEPVALISTISEIESIGFSPDGQFLIIKTNGVSKTVGIDDMLTFSDTSSTAQALSQSMTATPVFSSVVNGQAQYVLPDAFTGPESLNLKYQLIDDTPNAVVIGSSDNDFIKLANANSAGKAVDGGGGSDVIDGGVGSTFISGGGGNNTFFLDGRASGVSWSTITDFEAGVDKATVWGWRKGISKIALIDENGGAAGFDGLTLHFENLLPSDASDSARNSNWNSITLSGKSLSDFGVSSSGELIAQINADTNPYFSIGQTPTDQFGTHGYLHIA